MTVDQKSRTHHSPLPNPFDDTAIVLVAAGSSNRMGFDKMWTDVEGRPLVRHAVDVAVGLSPAQIVLVVAEGRLAAARQLVSGICIVAGGTRRRDSVARGLEASRCAWVAVHDAARTLVPPHLFLDGLRAARATGAALPVLPVKDTVKRVAAGRVQETLRRSDLVVVQTPQVFRRDVLERALALSDEDITDEATLVERLGVPIATFGGDERNFKLTTPFDLELVRWLLRRDES